MATIFRLGSRGQDVEDMQEALNLAPSRQRQLDADGIFGPKTRARVVEFQTGNRLVADGLAGPLTFKALKEWYEKVAKQFVPPADEAAARQKIVATAQQVYGLYHWGKTYKLSRSNPRIAGKLCADPSTRARQGGWTLGSIFAIGGGGNYALSKCLTISQKAEAMYRRKYTANERNNLDIASWCGIFAVYIYKLAGLNVDAFSSTYKYSSFVHNKNADPKPGDLGVVNAWGETSTGTNHHFIVVEVQKGLVKTIDGNKGLMEIVKSEYTHSKVRTTGAYRTPSWQKLLLK